MRIDRDGNELRRIRVPGRGPSPAFLAGWIGKRSFCLSADDVAGGPQAAQILGADRYGRGRNARRRPSLIASLVPAMAKRYS